MESTPDSSAHHEQGLSRDEVEQVLEDLKVLRSKLNRNRYAFPQYYEFFMESLDDRDQEELKLHLDSQDERLRERVSELNDAIRKLEKALGKPPPTFP